jgi:hypothetical protein
MLRTVRATSVPRGPSEDRAQTVRYSRCATGGSAFFFGLSVCDPRTVRPYHADRPPGHRGLSAWCLAELLSPLLLESCFRFGIVWGLFLGLVGPLCLRDLDKLVWESLVVNLGHRPSSLLGEEFLSAPIHSPLYGRLISPSAALHNKGR